MGASGPIFVTGTIVLTPPRGSQWYPLQANCLSISVSSTAPESTVTSSDQSNPIVLLHPPGWFHYLIKRENSLPNLAHPVFPASHRMVGPSRPTPKPTTLLCPCTLTLSLVTSAQCGWREVEPSKSNNCQGQLRKRRGPCARDSVRGIAAVHSGDLVAGGDYTTCLKWEYEKKAASSVPTPASIIYMRDQSRGERHITPAHSHGSPGVSAGDPKRARCKCGASAATAVAAM
ncbi:uncharacterized protein EI90DRAFT_3019114 [Cantharellus anzutake]|uniref:uncharacterized protein n=1 Tax=Cantharellus anzutake TaxID=1750568 RepID=UPI001907D7F6|nr:uncharacterized protein EI90DRAFT_3019114 [Cantharellus anzutake]KAF8325316.1 hypothetical protein EI90DRAFT_3019114 [Cantharellus anzutake]